MKSIDQQVQSATVFVNNALGSAPGLNWANPSGGTYDIRLTDPGAKLVAASANGYQGSGGAVIGIVPAIAFSETPPRAQVQILSAGATGGAWGGFATVQWRRLA